MHEMPHGQMVGEFERLRQELEKRTSEPVEHGWEPTYNFLNNDPAFALGWQAAILWHDLEEYRDNGPDRFTMTVMLYRANMDEARAMASQLGYEIVNIEPVDDEVLDVSFRRMLAGEVASRGQPNGEQP